MADWPRSFDQSEPRTGQGGFKPRPNLNSKLSPILLGTPLLQSATNPPSDRDVPSTHRLRTCAALARSCSQDCPASFLFFDRAQYVTTPSGLIRPRPTLAVVPSGRPSIGLPHTTSLNDHFSILFMKQLTNLNTLPPDAEKKWGVEKEGKILSFDG